jgi:hypothetical protein
VCGSTFHLDRKSIKAVSIPPWFWFLLPVAPVAALRFAARSEIQHRIDMLVCHDCHRRQKVATAAYFFTFVLCVVIMIGAVAIGLVNKSWLQFVSLSTLAGALITGGTWIRHRAYPRYTVLTQHKVEIEVPGKGRVIVFPT